MSPQFLTFFSGLSEEQRAAYIRCLPAEGSGSGGSTVAGPPKGGKKGQGKGGKKGGKGSGGKGPKGGQPGPGKGGESDRLPTGPG